MTEENRGNGHAKPELKASFKDKIGEDLKQLYDDVVKEPVPDSFLQLLSDADKNSGGGSESAR